jgi:hypothetical protein
MSQRQAAPPKDSNKCHPWSSNIGLLLKAASALALFILVGCKHNQNQTTTPKPKGPLGALIVVGAPNGCLLVIDEGYTYPLSPRSRLQLSIGKHRVEIECDGFFPLRQFVTIVENQETTLEVVLKPFLSD